MKNAFSMIELVFVIVILGILAAVAVPKFSATRLDAQITKGRTDVASIRSAIVSERQSRLIKGDSSWINKLYSSDTSYFDSNGTSANSLLMYAVTPKDDNGYWHSATVTDATANKNVSTYKYKIEDTDILFTYKQEDGTFDCDHSNSYCVLLTQ